MVNICVDNVYSAHNGTEKRLRKIRLFEFNFSFNYATEILMDCDFN